MGLIHLHLSVEKALKGLLTARLGRLPSKTHNLVTLARESGVAFTEKQLDLLGEMNRFSLESRYPDYKSRIRDIATPEFVAGYLDRATELRQWVLRQL